MEPWNPSFFQSAELLRGWKKGPLHQRGLTAQNDGNLLSFLFLFNWTLTGPNWRSDTIAVVPLNSFLFRSSPSSVSLSLLLPQPQNMTFSCEDEHVQRASPSLLSVSDSRSPPLAGCSPYRSRLSLRLLSANYGACVRCLTLGPAINWLITALTRISLCLVLSTLVCPFFFFFSLHSSAALFPQLLSLLPRRSQQLNCPRGAEGSDDTNKARFEIDFRSAPF